MSSVLYDRIVREKVAETWYNMTVSKQKYEQNLAAYENARKELETWENGGLKQFQEMERNKSGNRGTN